MTATLATLIGAVPTLVTTILAISPRLLDEAIGLDPKFALAHAIRARRLTFRGDITGREDYAAAIGAAQTAVAPDPQPSRAHHALGLALARAGRIDDARLAKQGAGSGGILDRAFAAAGAECRTTLGHFRSRSWTTRPPSLT